MQLLRLTIENVRGIRDLTLQLGGKSTVIWGPNGTGKSSIVDAIDFLFTGRISRLVDTGTKDIKLEIHGPHIDQKLESAVVEASVKLTGCNKPVVISRCMARHDVLVCPAAAKDEISAVSADIRNGGVILTRRDILNFVTAVGGTRADEIQNILNLSEIENVRKSLKNVIYQLRQKEDAAEHYVKNAAAAVNSILGLGDFSRDKLLTVVNECRLTHGGEPLETAEACNLKCNLTPLTRREAGEGLFNRTFFEQGIQQLQQIIHPDIVIDREKIDQRLRTFITKLKANEKLLQELKHLELTQMAKGFVDDSTTACPVCGQVYGEGHLKHLLDEKEATAKVAKETKITITEFSDALSAPAHNLLANIENIYNEISRSSVKEHLHNELNTLQAWQGALKDFLEILREPIELYLDSHLNSDDIARLLHPRILLTCSIALKPLFKRSHQYIALN